MQRIRLKAPDTTILLSSVTPRTVYFAPRLQALNEKYRSIAAETGVRNVDLWPALATGSSLNNAFTRDNLHLLAPAYRAWADALRPHLAEFATQP